MRTFFILWLGFQVLGYAVPSAKGADPSEVPCEAGRLFILPLVSAPFPHPQRAQGRDYKGKSYPADKHYRDSTVAVLAPQGFRETERIDFVVHFHGWNNHVTQVLERYRLCEQFRDSGRNAVLVVPQGPRDAPDSFGGKLEDPGGFRKFMDEVMAALREKLPLTNRNSGIGKIVLSGHSGGYQVVSSILDHGGLGSEVKEVWLFDALYAQTDRFFAWYEKNHGRFVDLYTEHGGTKEETEQFMSALKQRGQPFFAGRDSTVTSAELRQNQLLFLYTELEHDAVMQGKRAFQRFLESSILEPRIAVQ